MNDKENNRSQEKRTLETPAHYKIEVSAILTILGIILLFSTAIIATLIAPYYVDNAWTAPSSSYQVQMYEKEDPNIYIRTSNTNFNDLDYVHHLKEGVNFLAFKETESLRIVSSPELAKYVTSLDETTLKLTSHLLLLRTPQEGLQEKAHDLLKELYAKQAEMKDLPEHEKLTFQVLEVYDPTKKEVFSFEKTDGFLQDWVDSDYVIVDEKNLSTEKPTFGTIYVKNPQEFLPKSDQTIKNGSPVHSLEELLQPEFKFTSRKKLIAYGEHLYAIEGCWYCHTDQTRTLIQDTISNGTDAFPAPPSSPNEYIYQKITFPGTRRIGPDISRTGIRRPSREWHMAHFWDPEIAVRGSIMPKFRHFFNPNTQDPSKMGTPNKRFEAIYQYLMTKGTRITSPNQAWWIGKDPVQTKSIIESSRNVK